MRSHNYVTLGISYRDLKHYDGRHDDGIPEADFRSGHALNLKS